MAALNAYDANWMDAIDAAADRMLDEQREWETGVHYDRHATIEPGCRLCEESDLDD